MTFRKLVVFLAMVTISTLSFAQENSAVRGGLAGIVTDAGGAVIPNAKVVVVGPQGTVTITSDGSGHYQALGLTPGLYTVTVTAPGFETYVSKANEVTIDHTANLNAKMAVGTQDVTVEVDAGATAIDTENTSVNTAITDQFYEALPLPRNVSGAFYTAPGVVSGGGSGSANPSIGGSSGLENLYTADGVTITDQAYGGLGVYTPSHGSLGTGINLSFVKEVDIKTEAFEPKYGEGDGGIVEIVTKSGTNKFHGGIDAYVTPQKGFATAKQQYGTYGSTTGDTVTAPSSVLASPQYELSAQLGGYVPGFRDKLFFFGSFDPTLNRSVQTPYPNTPLAGNLYNFNTTSANWAAKITYLPLPSTVIEASSYGDPSRANSAPYVISALTPGATGATNADSVSSSYGFGTRNSIFRVSTTVLPWLTAFGAYSYNHANFHEEPTLPGEPGYSDRTGTPFYQYGVGTYYATTDNNWQLQGELQANAKFFGKHVLSVGYLYDHLDFQENTLRSGPGYTIPGFNAAGTDLTSIFSNIPAGAVGAHSNAQYRLFTSAGGCTYCALSPTGQELYFQVYRATYSNTNVNALARYHTAYGNEVYTPEKHLTINAGLRWEQQAYGGSLLTYYWRDNWSPRLGITVDPFGDRKTKVFFNYARYQVPLPLDAAVRQLGSELDDTTFYFAPQSVGGVATTDATGAYTPDTSVALNGTAKTAIANFGAPSFSSSTGEGILPGTKMEYTNEYVLSVEREVRPGMIAKIRYTDRQFGRIVEDIGSQSPEGSEVDGNYAGGIANVNSGTDDFVNEVEVVYTPAQFAAVNGGLSPGDPSLCDPTNASCLATPGNRAYVAPAAGCTYGNDTSRANGGFFTHFDGTNYDGACITNSDTAGALGHDGTSDGFTNPRRHYQAFELELNRSLRNHWQAKINYRYAKLYGNYEGFFRNDNGQSDPGISSLFDFTQGDLGLLGDQFKRGFLPTDRRNVANALIAYSVDKSTPYIGKLGNGLTVGTWLHASTGNPLSAFQSHPIYGNAGEVPIGGRGTKGTLPTAIELDLHVEDSFKLGEKYTIRGGFDAFNATNSQPTTSINEDLDTAPGVNNGDYLRPISWQSPFNARFKLAFEF